jgi:small subunit ribosomal protein S19e
VQDHWIHYNSSKAISKNKEVKFIRVHFNYSLSDKMADIRTIEPHKYNNALAEALKSVPEFKMPEWANFVKTSTHKKRPSLDPDFWYNRSASILRQIYINGIVGVERLRTRYGGRKNRGQRPAEFRKGAGKIIRVILQQAEAAGFVEKIKAKRAGRQLTEKGKEFLEGIKGGTR